MTTLKTETWVSPSENATKFKHNIETWLGQDGNSRAFQNAFFGDEKAFDWLPYWVAIGLRETKRKVA